MEHELVAVSKLNCALATRERETRHGKQIAQEGLNMRVPKQRKGPKFVRPHR